MFLFYRMYLYFFLDLKLNKKRKRIIFTEYMNNIYMNRYLLRHQFYEICIRRSIAIDMLWMFTRSLKVTNFHIMYNACRYTKYSK